MDTIRKEQTLRVLVAADDPLARAGLVALLSSRVGFEVVGQVSGQFDLPSEAANFRPDVILWDLGWSGTLNLERLVDVREVATPVIALLPDASHADEVRATGVRGLLLRDSSAATLLASLRAAYEGLMVLSPELSQGLADTSSRRHAPMVEDLTPREMEVLHLLAEGLPNKTIAQRLGVSDHTVKFHLNAIMGKLGVQSRTEAVVTATRLGLILL